ncbi:hypothetical protein [Actinoplanes sp. N902-109]|uniref:hypothetical protein n=1 Tax=Actinoplanes sp. (strain N902-109) TaxID=649831 RepID=UPI000329482B|nr:hypothetical protein [Actinoplanes sp. N902-109]AGL15141.1 hypothetical protein L083_1631 [Actinoplanes sp. N902-109]
MTGPAEPSAFWQRQRAAALSRWELGDLLGVHPHQLPDGVGRPNLAYLPAGVVIDLPRQLDLHPADLVPGLDAVLDNRRTRAEPPLVPGAETDALTVLTALATATGPMLVDELATALAWHLDRVHAALEHADAHPGPGGPLALRRTAPHTYTVSPRLDVLTTDQRTAVLNTNDQSQPLTVAQANALLAAITNHRAPHPDGDAAAHPDPASSELRRRAILHADHRPDHIEASPEVLYSLRYRDHPTGF